MTCGLETEWDYSGRKKGRDGQKKKIGKANEKTKKEQSKKEQKMKWMDNGEKGVPLAHAGIHEVFIVVQNLVGIDAVDSIWF